MEKSRIAALADGIFAVVMTLLVLDLKLPESFTAQTDADVWRSLVELKERFGAYALSFVVLGTYWVSHHLQFHFVHRVSRALLWLNLFFLLVVTLVPFSTNLLAGHGYLRAPIIVYGSHLLLLSLLLLLHLRHLRRHPELCHDGLTASRAADLRRRSAAGACIAAVSIALSFYRPALALNAYWLLLLFQFLPTPLDRHTLTEPPGSS